MQIGGEQHRDAEQREEIADQEALLALGGIDAGDEAEAKLLGDDAAGDLKRGDRQARRHAEHRPDQELLSHRKQNRTRRAQIDGEARAMKRQQHGREQ